MATVTVSVSATTTFTATYSNVSDTCSVTVPGPAYSLSFSQDTYTIGFLGCTVSCTLTNGGTPVSGETVTFSWEGWDGPTSVTAGTNSNGVATQGFDYFDFDSYPVTVTATYQGVSATCTLEEEL